MCQFTACHSRIANGEIEAIGNRLIQILVVNHMETVLTENLLQQMGTFSINADLLTEVVATIRSCLQHGCQGILGTMTGT